MTDHFSSGANVMIAQVPIGHVTTGYVRAGDLFSWLCVAGLATSVIAALR